MGKYSNVKRTRPVLFALVIVVLLANIASVVFGILNATNAGGLFHNSIGNLSAKYPTEFRPVPIAFGIIWPIIYLWTLAASIYLTVSLCLPDNESPVKTIPTLTSKTFLIGSAVAYLSTIAWLFAFDRELLIPSFVILLVGAAAMWQAIATLLVVVYDNQSKLERFSKTMLLVVRILVQNGLCLLATWLTVATLLGFSVAIVYVDSPGESTGRLRGLVSEEQGSTIGIALALVVMIAFFIIENVKYQEYFQYVFSVFPVFVFSFATVFAELEAIHPDGQNYYIAVVGLGLTTVCFVARVVFGVLRLVFPAPSSYYPKKENDKVQLM